MAEKAVSRRPSDVEVSKILREGGSDPETPDRDAWHVMNLRLPKWLVQQADEARKRRTGKVSRNQWILEAMEDKLERGS